MATQAASHVDLRLTGHFPDGERNILDEVLVKEVDFSDVHLLLTIAVSDREGRTFNDAVVRLRTATSFTVAVPRRQGTDFVRLNLEDFAFNRINYRVALDAVVAELRFVKKLVAAKGST